MQLTPEDIEEFQKIYKEGSGENLNDAEASAMAEQVVRLYAALAEPTEQERKKFCL